MRSLSELRKFVAELDPSGRDLGRKRPRRSLGILRRRQPLVRYIDGFAASEAQIRELIGTLRQGRSELQRNNAMIAQEERSLATLTQSLRQYADLAERLDKAVEAAAEAVVDSDPKRARLLVDDALFPIRQRRQDILTQLAVSEQGLAALAIVKTGNDRLIGAVDRVTTTTVAALRTAALVAQALTSDHVMAAQLQSINDLAAVVAALDKAELATSLLHSPTDSLTVPTK